MQINGPSQIHSAQPISAPHAQRVERPEVQAGFVAGGDEVSISREADLMSRINELPDIRQDRVNEVRSQLAAGVYETDAKLDVALERLLDEIA